MRGVLVLIFLTCLLPKVFASGVFSDPLLDGLTFYDAGEYQKAIPPLVEACDSGLGKACGMVGVIYLYNYNYIVSHTKPNNIKGIDYLIKGCALKDKDTCVMLKYIAEMDEM